MNKQKHISIRIDEITLKKFHHISKYDDRSASGQIMYLINKSIRDFEEAHGKINIQDEGTLTIS
ncbi:MAG: hypothetical protein FWF81_00480 [Defluviitaleaceae bacterium]|nr:hypothetical protein [Defluviitaleaceae bacterium]